MSYGGLPYKLTGPPRVRVCHGCLQTSVDSVVGWWTTPQPVACSRCKTPQVVGAVIELPRPPRAPKVKKGGKRDAVPVV